LQASARRGLPGGCAQEKSGEAIIVTVKTLTNELRIFHTVKELESPDDQVNRFIQGERNRQYYQRRLSAVSASGPPSIGGAGYDTGLFPAMTVLSCSENAAVHGLQLSEEQCFSGRQVSQELTQRVSYER